MKFLRFLLFPFAIIYGTLVFLRNKFYDWHLFPSSRFEIPIILVGNISTGGTGKSPHIEYLIRLLKPNFKVATLSRGYGRKTKGYILAKQDSSSEEIGDEPKQFKNKFEDILVAVDSDRANGIKQFESEFGQYKFSKGAVQFPLDEKLPLKLIIKMVKFRAKEDLAKFQ